MFGIVEVDEKLFGSRRLIGKHGRGSFGKTIVLGTFERGGKFILKLYQTAQKLPYRALWRKKSGYCLDHKL